MEATPTTCMKRKVLVVDAHPIIRAGLVHVIANEPDLLVCDEADDGSLAMKKIDARKPDVIILDVFLNGCDGIEFIKSLKAKSADLPILVFSIHEESLYAPRVLRAGARGYLMKQEPTEKVLIGLRRVLAGGVFLSENMSNRMLEEFVGDAKSNHKLWVDRLSDRELEVFRFIGQGQGTRRIAEKLHLSIKTIECYREHIKEKMMFRDASELVHHAIRWVEKERAL